jgi:hypothetical protein
MATQILADPQAVEDLTPTETEIWNSYQRFLRCIQPQVMSFDGMAVTAALLAFAAVSAPPVTPV